MRKLWPRTMRNRLPKPFSSLLPLCFTAKLPQVTRLRHVAKPNIKSTVPLDSFSTITALVWGILPGEEFQTIPALYQCGLNVFPVSSSVFRRERIRGHPSAQAAYVGSFSAHSSCVTITLVASVSGTSSIVARDALSFWPIAKVY